MKKIVVVLLVVMTCLVIWRTRTQAQEGSSCTSNQYRVDQTITASHFMVARYNPKVGSPGRLDIPEGTQFNLLEGPVCQSDSKWWRVQSIAGEDAWIAETGPFSLQTAGVEML